MANVLEILIRVKDQAGAAFKQLNTTMGQVGKAANSMGTAFNTAMGFISAQAIQEVGAAFRTLGKTIVAEASNAQDVMAQLDAVLKSTAKGGTEAFGEMAEDSTAAVEQMAGDMAKTGQSFADTQKKSQRELSQALQDIARETSAGLQQIAEQHAQRIRDINAQIAATEQNFRDATADREQDLKDQLTDMTEDYNDDRADLAADLVQAETKEQRKAIQERLADLEREFQQRKARADREAAQAQQRAMREHQKQLAALQKALQEEGLEYSKATQAFLKEQAVREQAVKDRFARELEYAKAAYAEELSMLQGQVADIGGVAPDFSNAIEKMTKDGLLALADSLSTVTRYEDEVIISAETMMLQFSNIGAKVFPQAISAAADLATRLGMDLPSAAMIVGRALNDPINAFSRLQRMGISFNESQKATITQMMATGDIIGAQGVLLDGLSEKFGGAARAAGETFGGSMERLKNAIGNAAEALGAPFLDNLTKLVDSLIKVLGYVEKLGDLFGKMPEWAQNVFLGFGLLVVGIGGLGDKIISFGLLLNTFKLAWGAAAVETTVAATTMGTAATTVATAGATVGTAAVPIAATGAAAGTASGGFWALAASALAALAPIALLIAAVGVLIYVVINLGPQALEALVQLAVIIGYGMEKISVILQDFIDSMIQGFKDLWDDLISTAKRMADSLRDWFAAVGQAIVDGIWVGIQGGWNWLVEQVEALAQSLLQAAKDALGIASPSREFAEQIGQPIAAGILQGFADGMRATSAGMKNILGQIPHYSARDIAGEGIYNSISWRPTAGIQSGAMPAVIDVRRVEFHGSFSDREVKRLMRNSRRMTQNVLLEALGG